MTLHASCRDIIMMDKSPFASGCFVCSVMMYRLSVMGLEEISAAMAKVDMC